MARETPDRRASFSRERPRFTRRRRRFVPTTGARSVVVAVTGAVSGSTTRSGSVRPARRAAPRPLAPACVSLLLFIQPVIRSSGGDVNGAPRSRHIHRSWGTAGTLPIRALHYAQMWDQGRFGEGPVPPAAAVAYQLDATATGQPQPFRPLVAILPQPGLDAQTQLVHD